MESLQRELIDLKELHRKNLQQEEQAQQTIEILSAENLGLLAKVKSTSNFKQLLKGLKNELEMQQSAFDEQIALSNSRDREFEDLKRLVSEHLGMLCEKDSEIIDLKGKLEQASSEITEKDL